MGGRYLPQFLHPKLCGISAGDFCGTEKNIPKEQQIPVIALVVGYAIIRMHAMMGSVS